MDSSVWGLSKWQVVKRLVVERVEGQVVGGFLERVVLVVLVVTIVEG